MNKIELKDNLKLLLASSSETAEKIGLKLISICIITEDKDSLNLIKTTLGINLYKYYINILKNKFKHI